MTMADLLTIYNIYRNRTPSMTARIEAAVVVWCEAVGGETLPTNQSSYNVQTSGVGNAQFYEVPYFLDAGEVATVDLSPAGSGDSYSNNNIRICWGRGSGTVPAMEAILYYRSGSPVKYQSTRRFFDSNAGRAAQNNADTGVNVDSCPNGPPGYTTGSATVLISMINAAGFDMPSGATPLFLRIRLLYNTAPWQVAVVAVGGDNIPVQGKDIVSTGQSGDSTQKLHVIQSTPDFPLMFDSALFSGGGGGLVQ
jgi:hypothetical protein